jgi:thiamine biosynthesis protein ThiI
MKEIILCKLGEIVLKGLNRRSFEQKLLSNLRHALYPLGKYRVWCSQSTVYIEAADENADMDAAFEAAKKVFGVIKLSRAAACEKDKDAIVALAKDYLREDLMRVGTFKVESKRSDKRFPMTSIELSQYVGGELAEAFPHLRAEMHEPELVVNLEIRDVAAYVHAAPVDGAGGMPVGSNGVAVTLLSGGIDSPVSSYMIAKRGVRLVPVHFFSFPYTSEAAKEKDVELARLLSAYCGRMPLLVVPFTHIQEEIRDKCDEEYFTLIMRRFMMRIAERIALDCGARAIVTGENLGQVASQTMEAMASTQAVLSLPVLQPLIGLDKEEIVRLARRIGTFETSILPYEDCCTIFVARHPVTRPVPEKIRESELLLSEEIGRMVEEAVASKERILCKARR